MSKGDTSLRSVALGLSENELSSGKGGVAQGYAAFFRFRIVLLSNFQKMDTRDGEKVE